MPKKEIDQQNPEIRLRLHVCFRLQQFSSFPCTFEIHCFSRNLYFICELRGCTYRNAPMFQSIIGHQKLSSITIDSASSLKQPSAS